MIYKMQIPPFPVKSFDLLTTRQAKEIFKWYTDDIPARLDQLQKCIDADVNGTVQLTRGKDSLRPLWSWLVANIQLQELTESDLKESLDAVPKWLHEYDYYKEPIEKDDFCFVGRPPQGLCCRATWAATSLYHGFSVWRLLLCTGKVQLYACSGPRVFWSLYRFHISVTRQDTPCKALAANYRHAPSPLLGKPNPRLKTPPGIR